MNVGKLDYKMLTTKTTENCNNKQQLNYSMMLKSEKIIPF